MHNLSVHNDQSLWIGLESYNESNSNIFFGRDEEILQLSNDIFHNIQTIIYGPSGIGKTSIIRAGVFKIARERGYFPIYIRLLHDDEKGESYYKQVVEAIESEAKVREIDIEQTTHYVKKEGDKEICGSLWEYFHCNEFWTKENYPITPLIVVDQFEEIFTLCQDRTQQADFFEQISDLCDNKLPSYIKDYINNRDNERVEHLESANYRFVISLREDFLARLEELAENIPALKRNRFSLQCLNEEQALDIITKPLPGLISENVAIQIIERVTGKIFQKDFTLHDKPEILVEPSILSLFCSELDKKRKEQGMNVVSENLIGQFGDNIIKDFYIDCLKDLSQDKIEFIEIHLLTVDGYRDAEALQNAKKFGFTDDEITNLTNRRLVRIEERNGIKRLEFTHDVLCKVASKDKQERETQRIRQEEEKKRQRIQKEQESERTKRNLEYNYKKRAIERNVLVHKGRRLIDNALDFGELRTINGIPLRNPIDKMLTFVRLATRSFDEYFENLSDSEFVNQQVFRDPLLKNSNIVLSFYKDDESAPTIDGIYQVELKYEGSLISDIFFKGRKVLADGSLSFDEPIYILGGYCGIHIDYDESQREIRRTYLDDSANPIITLDGYSVIQTEYDEKDNPIKVRFFNIRDGKLYAAKHIHGNHGYDSFFDKNGNEVERHFIDENEFPTTIVSGVYGKRMTYDPNSFHLMTISNIDSKGYLMADIDGYVTDSKEYDSNGLPTIDYYLDKNGQPWRNPSGVYGEIAIIDFINNTITTNFIDEHGSCIEDKDGVRKIVSKINDKRQITELYSLDKDNNIVADEDNSAIQLWRYDQQNRLQSVQFLNKERSFVSGMSYDYNKEGTHIVRIYFLSENGIKSDEDLNVEGIEYSLEGDETLPILQMFINENKQFKKCKDGYYAVRIWFDDKERVVKRLYYGTDGAPMPNNSGVFGVKMEYLDAETTKLINLDADGNMIEDNNGVAFTIETSNSSCVVQINYNIDGKPSANDDWVYIHKEKENTNQGYQEKLFVLNSSKEYIQINRLHLADERWGFIQCSFVETAFDKKGRPLSEYFKDANGDLVGDPDGDSYSIWEYDDEKNQEIISLYKTNGEISVRVKTIRDFKGRILEKSYINKDGAYVELERGYSGEIWEYDDEENSKTVTFIDSMREICNNKEGFAHRIYWYDNLGRLIAQKDLTADGIIYGNIGFREYIDSERRECAYYLHREDGLGHTIINDNGSMYEYCEEDNKGRIIKRLYLSADKLPQPDADGDFGLSYEYDDERRLTILTCLNESGLPHNNKVGYSSIHSYENEEGKEIKRMYFTVEGAPITLSDLLGCYGLSFEYPNEHNKIVGYLNEKEEITTNNHGYAYREECIDPQTGIRRYFYYDKNGNNTQSWEDETKDFGYEIYTDENRRQITSLGKDGQVVNNAAGYARRIEEYREGELRFYYYVDASNKPIADSAGDYGTEILRSDDGSMVRTVSLNSKNEPHINDYGYCLHDIITDIAGDKVHIYRDTNNNQVLPKKRFVKRIKNLLSRLRKKENLNRVFNCRQIGAICYCVLGHVEGHGSGRKHGLQGTYVLMAYDNWKFGDEIEKLENLMKETATQSKHVALLPISLNGSLLQDVGEVNEFDFPGGEIGIRFKDWEININTLYAILEKQQKWENAQ